MVAAELALAIVLLTGTGLMLKSFWRMNTHPPEFAPDKTLVMRIALSGPQYNDWLHEDAYIHELMRRIGSAPGVQAVGIDRATLNIAFKMEGAQPSRLDDQAVAAFRAVSLGYLRALGVPLLRGDWPPNDESFDSFMVNETFARMMMGNGDPIGRHVSTAFLKGIIVGVVADSKTWQLDAEPSPEVYIPYQLSPAGRSIRVVVRTSGDPKAVAPTIRNLVSAIDLTQPVYAFQTLEQALGDSIAPRHFNLFLLGTFAATALAMALVGVYGVMAYSVTQRTHEIGIRMALGAQRCEVVGVVVRQGMVVALVGIVIGVVAARGLTRLMASLLYNVKPNDPLTFAAVVVVLAATALLACCGPALRAARIDPIIALRYE
jgi:putative ABC transport system permease protein